MPRCDALKALGVLSLTASLLLMGVLAAVMWYRVTRDLVLFIGALIVVVEFLLFAYYCVTLIWFQRYKITWHAHRVWIPFYDLFWLAVAMAVSINLLEWSTEASALEQFSALTDAQRLSLIFVVAAMLVKLVTAHLLTLVHARILAYFARSLPSSAEMNTYPYGSNLPESVKSPPSAPEAEFAYGPYA